jgi:hypothetical protein
MNRAQPSGWVFSLGGYLINGYLSAIYPHQKIGISPSIEIDVVLYDLLEFPFPFFSAGHLIF